MAAAERERRHRRGRRRQRGQLAGPAGRAPARAHPALTTLSQRAEYAAYRAGSLVGRLMPVPIASAIARSTQPLLASVYRGRGDMTSMARSHLRHVYGGDVSDAELDRRVRRLMDSYARYYMELFLMPSMSPERIDASIVFEGDEHVYEAREKGNGVLIVMPHTGNWDLAGAWLAQRVPCTAVVERLEPPELYEWFNRVRHNLRVDTVPLGPQAGPALMKALRANRIVGLLCDRDIGGTGVEVEFFGERTKLPGGPATLALRSGAAILPSAAYFDDEVGHRGVIGPPVAVERTGRLREDVVRITQTVTDELEKLIRRAPTQWHNFQPTWPSEGA
ncbi:MAG: phosphatidylinositol mannoside acyltransferase [Acidimicrobiia bacterium]|nr:phosphatidylinositol mannoside acyltransferase [Acidimicrobiia bacterium]